ncbi:MAG: methyltransferase domain-containing protein [Thaumarchaeota archaeon]|nr:methyltransferase domain-containing protein [Nitrososphaerota archaeon]
MTEQRSEPGVFAPEKLAKLVTVGRSTQLPHIVMVRFAQSGGAFFVLAGKAGSDWVLNSLAAGRAKLRLGEYAYEVSVAVERDSSRVLELYSKKYGRALTSSWYSAAETCLKLTPTAPPVRRGAARGEGEAKTDFAMWRKENGDYYAGVANAFDSASDEYDFTIRNNFINRWIRDRSIRELLKLTRPDDTLLEIGCGTGAEAVEISKHVTGIVATDISPSMIGILRRKVDARRLGKKVRPLQLSASEVSLASSALPGGRARIVYSFNGALNCEPEIERFPGELSKVMEDAGFFVCSIRNSFCLSEAVAHGAVLQFGKMAPRKRQPVMVSVGGMDIPSYYYRPRRFADFFSSRFSVKKMIGLPAILPPAYLSDIYFKARGLLSFTERAEEALAGTYPFNRFGDQTLFVFQKRRESTP